MEEGISPAIVVVAYNRPAALLRLLMSIERAGYPTTDVRLIVSIDGGGDRAVVDVARGFHFSHGSVEVIEQGRRLGLREHVLCCGDLAEQFGSVIVLEDDLVVDVHFYAYAQRALGAYLNVDAVAGVALHSPRYNELAGLPFLPLRNGKSTFFMSVPCSWGQAWTAAQWRAFRDWYAEVDAAVIHREARIPEFVRSWPESSWKKFFYAFLILTDRAFVYPYDAYSSNCDDPLGTHIGPDLQFNQVPMGDPGRPLERFDFPVYGRDYAIFYDAYMEASSHWLGMAMDIDPGRLCVDLYGQKPESILRQYELAITLKSATDALHSFPLTHLPVERNALFPDTGVGVLSLARTQSLQWSRPADWFAHARSGTYVNFWSRRFLRGLVADYARRHLERLRRKMVPGGRRKRVGR